ncbi:MAG TPA: twin-arginine translocase subunit TatC [Ktedonobacterales bacterium]
MAATDARMVPPLESASPSGGSQNSPQNEQENEDTSGVMTLVEHLEELRRRLIFAMIAVAACTVVAFIFWDPIFGFLLTPLPAVSGNPELIQHGKLVISDPVGSFMVALKVSLAVGIAASTPVVLYQLWGFLAPGLTRKERKYVAPFTFLGVALFAIGLAVGFVTLRYPMDWLLTFGSDRFIPLINADAYFTFVTYFLLAFGIVFELPLVITFLGVVGIVNSRLLRQKRMYILFSLWFISAFITPGADPISPVIVGVAFTALFELSVLLLRVIKK